MLTNREIKNISSDYRIKFALNQYEKFKRDCFGIENDYSKRLGEDYKDHLYFTEIGVNLEDQGDLCYAQPICNLTSTKVNNNQYVPPSNPNPPDMTSTCPDKYKITASTDFNYTFTCDLILDKILIIPPTNQNIKIGTTPGGNQIIDGWNINSLDPQPLDVGHFFPIGRKVYFSGLNSQSNITLYFQ